MIGRSHAIHGEPIIGFEIAGWLAETERNRSRLARLEEEVAVGQISGAMGTYANTDPQVEAITCELLGLTPDTASTQVILIATPTTSRPSPWWAPPRSLRHGDPQPATHRCARGGELRQGPEGQLRHAPQAQPDPQRADQRPGPGAAVMWWRPCNVALWHERDISQLHRTDDAADCSVTLHFMREMTSVVKGLGVYPDNMRRNMNVYGGVVFSQRVLLALVGTGMSREGLTGLCSATPTPPGA